MGAIEGGVADVSTAFDDDEGASVDVRVPRWGRRSHPPFARSSGDRTYMVPPELRQTHLDVPSPRPSPLDLPDGSFAERVYAVVRQIPEGRVTSYGAVAALVGSPRAARGVGAALNGLLPEEDDVPWWRVVNRIGVLSIPAELGLRSLQRTLLEAEHVTFLESGRVDLDRHAWDVFGDDEDQL